MSEQKQYQIIGIVGSSKAEYNQCTDVIVKIFNDYPENTIFVTGGALGVDFAVRSLCLLKGKQHTIIYSKTKNWDGFKKRNEIIAQYCDKIISIVLPFEKNKGQVSCYHCKRNDHQKTAGCYTGKVNGNYEVKILT